MSGQDAAWQLSSRRHSTIIGLGSQTQFSVAHPRPQTFSQANVTDLPSQLDSDEILPLSTAVAQDAPSHSLFISIDQESPAPDRKLPPTVTTPAALLDNVQESLDSPISVNVNWGPDQRRYDTIAAPGTHKNVLIAPRHAATTDSALGPERSAPPSPTTPIEQTPRANKSSLLTIATTRAGLAHQAIQDTLNSPTPSAVSFASAALWTDSPSTGVQRRLSSILSPSGSTHPTVVPDTPSPVTKEVYTEGLLGLSLLGLCQMLQERPSLQRAQVRSTRTFVNRPGLHRFLVCELLIGRDIFWLRLDRLRDRTVSRWRAPHKFFGTAAHGEVDVAAEASLLYDKAAKEENHQTFLHPLFLGELLHFLKAFCEEAHRYTTWPMNCWFLCSSVQEHLHTFHHGIFKKGALQHTHLAPDVRRRIRARLPPHYATSPSSPIPPAPPNHRFRPPIVKAPPRRRTLAMWGRTAPPLSQLPGYLTPMTDTDPPSATLEFVPLRQRALTQPHDVPRAGEELFGQFIALYKEVQDVVRQWSRVLLESRRSADAIKADSILEIARNAVICRGLSTDDYLFCVISSIFTRRAYERILVPDSSTWGADDIGSRRRKTLPLIATFNTIVQDVLDILPDGTDVPDDFQSDLKNILTRLYTWNERAASSPPFSIKYQVYAVKPFAEWDPGKMEAGVEQSKFALMSSTSNKPKNSSGLEGGAKVEGRIILPLSLGLVQYQLRAGKWVLSAHVKAKVLVDSSPLSSDSSSPSIESRETMTPDVACLMSMPAGADIYVGQNEVQAVDLSSLRGGWKLEDSRPSGPPSVSLYEFQENNSADQEGMSHWVMRATLPAQFDSVTAHQNNDLFPTDEEHPGGWHYRGNGTHAELEDASIVLDDFFASPEEYLVPDTSSSLYSLTRLFGNSSTSTISSNLTHTSILTFIPENGGYGGSLDHLCKLIHDWPVLQSARIVSSECYMEPLCIPLPTGTGLVHRYLLLELKRHGKKTIWVRLDRKRMATTSLWDIFRAAGRTPAHDTIQLHANKETLVENGQVENRQTYSDLPTMRQFDVLLRVMRVYLKTYQVWPQNCWFFVSLLQQHLGKIGGGSFIHGTLPVPDLQPKVRRKIEQIVAGQWDSFLTNGNS